MKYNFLRKRAWLLSAAVLLGTVGTCGIGYAAEEGQEQEAAQESEEASVYVECMPAAEGAVFEEYVKKVTVNGVSCFAFMPGTEKLVINPGSSPVIMVYGDAPCTEADIPELVKQTGLYDIAYEEGAVILFVNPANGEAWEEADADTYLAALGNDVYNLEYTYQDGTYYGEHGLDLLPGNVLRTYVIGIGTGADFVENNLMKNVNQHIDFGDGNTLDRNMPPTSVILAHPSAQPEKVEEDVRIPAAVITAEEEGWKESLTTVAGEDLLVLTDEGKGLEKVAEAYKLLAGNYMRVNGELMEIPDYEALDIHEERKEFMSGDARYEGLIYYAEDLDMAEEDSIPVVLNFPGNPDGEVYGWRSQWPLVAKENDFMTIILNKYQTDNSCVDSVIGLLDALKTEYPCIDKTRIYVASNGFGTAREGWNLAFYYPEYFAGIQCTEFECFLNSENTSAQLMDTIMGSKPLEELEVKECIIPFYYAASTDNLFSVTPSASESVAAAIGKILKMNQVTDNFAYDETADPVWGIAADSVFYEGDGRNVPSCKLLVNGYKSADGNTYTLFESAAPRKGQDYGDDAWITWEFFKAFSRNEDGSLSIEK